MYLSKEVTNKDESLKMRLLLSSDDKPSLDTEFIWQKKWLFWWSKGGVYLHNTDLCQPSSISTFKGGEHTIYLDYVILGQLICAKTMPEDFENYEWG